MSDLPRFPTSNSFSEERQQIQSVKRRKETRTHKLFSILVS